MSDTQSTHMTLRRLRATLVAWGATGPELLAFDAKNAGKTAQLQWITGFERECAHFTVQRSSDGYSWKNIGEIQCQGNDATGETNYTFKDLNPYKGLNYYRLEQVDFSGQSSKSPVRVLSFASSGYSLQISSSEGQAYFEVIGEEADEQDWRLEIHSMDGRELQSLQVSHKGWLRLPDAPSGVYAIYLRDAEGRAVAAEKWLWMK